VLTVRELTAADLAQVDRHLPLNRLDQHAAEGSTYLVAWEDDLPVGHAHIAWTGTHLGLPEIQDVFVAPEHRRLGVATALTEAAENAVQARGNERISLSVSLNGNPGARQLYDGLGYADAGVPPVRVEGEIMLRGQPFHADDTLVYLTKTI